MNENSNRRRIWAVTASAAAVAAVTVGIVAFQPNQTIDTQPTAAGAGDAVQALRDSVAGLRAGNYTFTRTGAGFIADVQEGTAALPGGASIRHTATYAVATIGAETYLQYSLHMQPEMREQYLRYIKENTTPAEAKKYGAIYDQLDGVHWVRTDMKKLADTAAVEEQSGLDSMASLPTADQPDATGAAVLADRVTTAERSGDVITGTLDATGAEPVLQQLFNDPAYLYGPAAKAMPFRATLDGQGRLTEFTVTMPGEITSQPAEPVDPTPPLVIRISGYGSTQAPAVPAEVAGELSTEAYDMLARDTD